MALEILKAMCATTVVLAGWLAVQRAWRAAFPGESPGGDALEGRTGCHGCACEGSCEDERPAHRAAPGTN